MPLILVGTSCLNIAQIQHAPIGLPAQEDIEGTLIMNPLATHNDTLTLPLWFADLDWRHPSLWNSLAQEGPCLV